MHYRRVAIEANNRVVEQTLLIQDLRAASAPQPIPPAPRAPVFPERSAQSLSSNALADLKRQVSELQASVQARDAALASLRQSMTNAQPAEGWRRREEWLEELRTNDPAQYDQIMKEREEARQRVKDSFARKAAHFLEHDTSLMNDTEKQQYNQMLQLLDETWALSDKLRAENLPRDERREIWGQMRDNMRTLSPMLDAERDKEFYNVAMDLGYNEAEAAEFVSYLTNIIDVTSMRSVFQGGRGPGGWGETNR
jgi:hypothetical protein